MDESAHVLGINVIVTELEMTPVPEQKCQRLWGEHKKDDDATPCVSSRYAPRETKKKLLLIRHKKKYLTSQRPFSFIHARHFFCQYPREADTFFLCMDGCYVMMITGNVNSSRFWCDRYNFSVQDWFKIQCLGKNWNQRSNFSPRHVVINVFLRRWFIFFARSLVYGVFQEMQKKNWFLDQDSRAVARFQSKRYSLTRKTLLHHCASNFGMVIYAKETDFECAVMLCSIILDVDFPTSGAHCVLAEPLLGPQNGRSGSTYWSRVMSPNPWNWTKLMRH